MTKDTGILVAIPPDLKEWVDAQANDIGVNAEIWIRMLVFAARRNGNAPPALPAPFRVVPHSPSSEATTIHSYDRTLERPTDAPGAIGDPAEYDAQGNLIDPDAWRGPIDDDTQGDAAVDVNAIINSRLADAEAAGLTAPAQQPYEAFGAPPGVVAFHPAAGGARAVRRPLPGGGLLAPAGSRIGQGG